MKYKKKYIVIVVLLLVLLTLGISYGYFTFVGGQDKFIRFHVGECLDITITEESDAIGLSNIYPVTNEEGLNYTPYTFTIKNSCATPSNYQISLESILESDNTLDVNYIKASLEDSEGRINTNLLGSLPETDLTLAEGYDSRKLYSGLLNGNEETNFKLRLWLDYDATKEVAANKSHTSKIVVSARSDEVLTDEVFNITYTENSSVEGYNGYYKSYETITSIEDTKDDKITAKYCVGNTKCTPNINVELNNNTFTYNHLNGESMICTQARDSKGNRSVIRCSELIKVDTEAPSINYVIEEKTDGVNNWYQALKIRLEGIDDKSQVKNILYCTTTEDTCEPTIEVNNNASIIIEKNSLSQKICSIVTDNNDNSSEVICSGTYKVDTKNPEVSITYPVQTSGSNGWYKALSVKGTASDTESNIAHMKYCTTTSTICTPNEIVTGSEKTVVLSSNASAQKVCFEATDNSGRSSGVICSNTYKVDTSTTTAGASVYSSTNGENGWYKALKIKVSASNNYSGITSVRYCTTTSSSCTPNTSISNNGVVTLGTNANAQKVCVNATDGKGETTTTSCSGAYYVDGEAPTINTFYIGSSSNPATVDNVSTNVYIAYSGTASKYCIQTSNTTSGCNWINTSASPMTKGYTLSSGDGTKTLYAFIKDAAGNISAVKSDSITLSTKKIVDDILNNNGGKAAILAKGNPDFTATNNHGMYAADDEWTSTTGEKSYYFRGILDNNWVKFGKNTSNQDLYWRIIRINGNGSIRLIYNGPTTDQTGTTTQIGLSAFNTSSNRNAYVGYMYYHSTLPIASSTIKEYLDTWYNNNLKTNYASYIDTNAGFCGDRRLYSGTGDNTDSTRYASYNRLYNTFIPMYKCTDETNDLYTISSSTKGNKKLVNPIGLITMDEAMYAGGLSTENKQFWLYTEQEYWTISPGGFSMAGTGYSATGCTVTTLGRIRCNSRVDTYYYANNQGNRPGYGARPVINLKADVLKVGNGTTSNPYRIS